MLARLALEGAVILHCEVGCRLVRRYRTLDMDCAALIVFVNASVMMFAQTCQVVRVVALRMFEMRLVGTPSPLLEVER